MTIAFADAPRGGDDADFIYPCRPEYTNTAKCQISIAKPVAKAMAYILR